MQLIAHRGFSSKYTENTISAMKAALECGVDGIEMDIRLSKDNIPVVFHDSTLRRLYPNGGKLGVEALTLAEIQALEFIPSLQEVLELFGSRTQLMLEIKEAPRASELVKLVKELIHPFQNSDNILLGSLDLNIQQQLCKECSDFRMIGIVDKAHLLQKYLQLPLQTVALSKTILSDTVVKNVRDKEMQLWSFTINSARDLEWIRKFGVDAAISDNAELF